MEFIDKMQWIAILAVAIGNFSLTLGLMHNTEKIHFIYKIFDAITINNTKENNKNERVSD